jgi:hypothetical protein
MPNFQPGKEFGGDFVAGLTDIEKGSLTGLGTFLDAPNVGKLFGVSKQNLIDTIGGRFADPNESPFIKSAINLSKINLRDAIDSARARRGGRGTFFTSEGIEEEGRLTNQSLANLDAVIGNFINQERGRQISSIPLALQADLSENIDIPLQKLGAAQSLGSLSRVVEQARLEAEHQDFLRKQRELGGVVDVGLGVLGPNKAVTPGFTTPITEQNNSLGNILEIISQLNLEKLNTKEGLSGAFKSLPQVLQGVK